MKRLLPVLILALAVFTPAAARATLQHPDIVVLQVDDLGYFDDAALSVLERLPNIRHLFVDAGLRFTNARNETPLCCPSRANFLTGMHTADTGVVNNRTAYRMDASRTIATALDAVGYETYIFGKYLNHSDLLPLPPPGWDHSYINHDNAIPNHWTVDGQAYTSHKWVDRTIIDFVQATDFAADPLFVYLNPRAPHYYGGHDTTTPYRPYIEDRYLGDPRCKQLTPFHPPTYRYAAKPKGWPLSPACRGLLTVDELVGAMEAKLAGRDVTWVFLSDNGMDSGQRGMTLKNAPWADRQVLAFSGPGIPAGTRSGLLSTIDIPVTLAELAGAAMPWASGASFTALLGNVPASTPFRSAMLENHPNGGRVAVGRYIKGWWGVVTPEWRLIKIKGKPIKLYHADDVWGLHNLASAYPDIVQQLKALRYSL